MQQEINDSRPHRSENEQAQNQPRVAKRREVEFGAAVDPGRNHNFRVRRRGHIGRIGLKGRRSDSALEVVLDFALNFAQVRKGSR